MVINARGLPRIGRIDAPDEAFAIGEIPCMKCTKCGVVRELEQIWVPAREHKPLGAREAVCTHCR